MRKADAGVASGAFDDRAARFERAFDFSAPDHPQRSAILDRAAWVQEFSFGEYFTACFFA